MQLLSTKPLRKAHPTDAAFDIEASERTMVPTWGSCLVSTGLRVAIPAGYCGILKSRSGLSVKHGIEVGAGVIDAGYRGEVKVQLWNHSVSDFWINPGDRIAQLMIVPVPDVEVIVTDELPDADRGANGFGSSGVGND